MGHLLVYLDVSNPTLRLALTYVLESAGHGMCRERAVAEAAVVDGLSLVGNQATTLVVDPVPAACQLALDAVMRGSVRSAICSDEPETLPAVIESALSGTVALPSRLIEQANRAPRLSRRLRATLRLVLAGYTNRNLALQLHQSESTVKRDINALLVTFDAHNRLSLIGAARTAGFDQLPGSRVAGFGPSL